MNEPQTDAELEAAIRAAGYTFVDHGDNSFSIVHRKTGSWTSLEASQLSDALLEAYMLVKS